MVGILERGQSKSNRIAYIDAAKGIGILLMILGHTGMYGLPVVMHKMIYSFHMPMYFIISGFLFNTKKYENVVFSKFIKREFIKYIIPYFVFAFINLVLCILFDLYKGGLSISVITEDLLKYIPGILYCYADIDHMPNCSPIWFLMCLFSSRIVYFCIKKYLKKGSNFICLIFPVISYILSAFVPFILPFRIATVPCSVAFMALGNIIKNHKILEKSKLWYACVAIPGLVVSCFNIDDVGLSESTYSKPLYFIMFLFTSVLVSYSIMLIVSRAAFLQNKFFVFLGSTSITAIGYNYFLRTFTGELYYFIPFISSIPMNWMTSFVLTVLFTVLLCLLSRKKLFKIPLCGKFS